MYVCMYVFTSVTCSETFAVGCIVQPQCTASQTDGQTDDSMMPIADHDRLKVVFFQRRS